MFIILISYIGIVIYTLLSHLTFTTTGLETEKESRKSLGFKENINKIGYVITLTKSYVTCIKSLILSETAFSSVNRYRNILFVDFW